MKNTHNDCPIGMVWSAAACLPRMKPLHQLTPCSSLPCNHACKPTPPFWRRRRFASSIDERADVLHRSFSSTHALEDYPGTSMPPPQAGYLGCSRLAPRLQPLPCTVKDEPYTPDRNSPHHDSNMDSYPESSQDVKDDPKLARAVRLNKRQRTVRLVSCCGVHLAVGSMCPACNFPGAARILWTVGSGLYLQVLYYFAPSSRSVK